MAALLACDQSPRLLAFYPDGATSRSYASRSTGFHPVHALEVIVGAESMTSESSNPILETRLVNGLGVLLKEDHSAPIASVWTWYRVGSRNELPGKTGMSHWVEHMQFKGTPRLEKGRIFGEVSRVGGTLNALTSDDW